MADAPGVRLDRKEFRLLLAVFSALVAVILFARTWHVPQETDGKYWNGLLAFTILAVACDLYFLPFSRISAARLSSSVVFIPLLATVLLFDHPWPMLISGATAAVTHSTMRKPWPRAWFNVAQYMLAVGLGDALYRALGGASGLNGFKFSFLPFCALVVTYFIVNQGSVALAIASTTNMSVRTSWSRIVGGSLLYDFAATSFAVLLAYLFADHGVRELAILIVPLLIVRHVYQMNLQAERVNRELLELMVKAIEARSIHLRAFPARVRVCASHRPRTGALQQTGRTDRQRRPATRCGEDPRRLRSPPPQGWQAESRRADSDAGPSGSECRSGRHNRRVQGHRASRHQASSREL